MVRARNMAAAEALMQVQILPFRSPCKFWYLLFHMFSFLKPDGVNVGEKLAISPHINWAVAKW